MKPFLLCLVVAAVFAPYFANSQEVCGGSFQKLYLDGILSMKQIGGNLQSFVVPLGEKDYGSVVSSRAVFDATYFENVTDVAMYLECTSCGGMMSSTYYDVLDTGVYGQIVNGSFNSIVGRGTGLVDFTFDWVFLPHLSMRDTLVDFRLRFGFKCRTDYGSTEISDGYQWTPNMTVQFTPPNFPAGAVLCPGSCLKNQKINPSVYYLSYNDSFYSNPDSEDGTQSFCGMKEFMIMREDYMTGYYPYAPFGPASAIEDLAVYRVYQESGDKVAILPPENPTSGLYVVEESYRYTATLTGTTMATEQVSVTLPVGKFSVGFVDVNPLLFEAAGDPVLEARICVETNAPLFPYCFTFVQQLEPPEFTMDYYKVSDGSSMASQLVSTFENASSYSTMTFDGVKHRVLPTTYVSLRNPTGVPGPTYAFRLNVQKPLTGTGVLPVWVWDLEFVDENQDDFVIVSDFTEVEVGVCESDSTGSEVDGYVAETSFRIRARAKAYGKTNTYAAMVKFRTSLPAPWDAIAVPFSTTFQDCPGNFTASTADGCTCPAGADATYDSSTGGMGSPWTTTNFPGSGGTAPWTTTNFPTGSGTGPSGTGGYPTTTPTGSTGSSYSSPYAYYFVLPGTNCECVDSDYVPATGLEPAYCECRGNLELVDGECGCPTGLVRVDGTYTCVCAEGFVERPIPDGAPENTPRRCVRQTPLGGRCNANAAYLCGADAVCDEGNGVCCDQVCDGECQGCASGTCTNYARGLDPERECPGIGCDGSMPSCLITCTETAEDPDADCDVGYECGFDGVCRDEDNEYTVTIVVEIFQDYTTFDRVDFRESVEAYLDGEQVGADDSHIFLVSYDESDYNYLSTSVEITEVQFVVESDIASHRDQIQDEIFSLNGGDYLGWYQLFTAPSEKQAEGIVNTGSTTGDTSKDADPFNMWTFYPALALTLFVIFVCVPAVYCLIKKIEAEANSLSDDTVLQPLNSETSSSDV